MHQVFIKKKKKIFCSTGWRRQSISNIRRTEFYPFHSIQYINHRLGYKILFVHLIKQEMEPFWVKLF